MIANEDAINEIISEAVNAATVAQQLALKEDGSELHSTLLDAGHPNLDLVAVHAAVPDLQHLLVPSQGGGKRLKDGRFTGERLLYDWSVTKSRLDPGSISPPGTSRY